ncbi:MAG: hypothetical protein ACK5Y2_14425, partial [Bdellovibrionales bacterium]
MKKVLCVTFLISMIACSKGFQTQGLESENTSLDKVSDRVLTGFVRSGPFEGFQVVDNIQNQKLQVIVPASFNSALVPGSFSSGDGQVVGRVVSDSTGFKSIQIFVPAGWISQGVSLPRVQTLPTGEALTLFPNSEAGHMMVPLTGSNSSFLHLYFNPPRFAAFGQTPFQQEVFRPYPRRIGSTPHDLG